MKQQIDIKSMVRATPNHDDNNGNCQEVINMRFKDGSWRSLGTKTDTGNDLSSNYSNFYKHPSLGQYRIIAEKTSTDKIVVLDASDELFETAIVHMDSEGSTLIGYAHINDYLIVTTTVDRHIFKWSESGDAYTELEAIETPYLSVHEGTIDINQTVTAGTDYATAKVNYLAFMAEKRLVNRLEGHMLFRMAFRLYDNSFIGYSDIKHYKFRGDGGDAFYYYAPGFYFNNLAVSSAEMELYITSALKSLLITYEGLVKSLVIFATDIESHFDVSSDDPTEWSAVGGGVYSIPDKGGIEEIVIQKSSYYNIKEIPLDELTGIAGTTYDIGEIDLSFIDSIEVRESLPLYESPNRIGAKVATIYNGKIHLGYIYEFLNGGNNHGHYDVDKAGYTNMAIASDVNHKFYYCFYIDTDQGQKIVIKQFKPFIFDDGAAESYALFNPVTIYPDTRCFKVVPIVYEVSSGKYYFPSFGTQLVMKPHESLNLSYNVGSGFPIRTTGVDVGSGIGAETSLPTESYLLTYANKFRLSALNNPLTYPAINTYVVEDDSATIIGFGLMSEPLSESQVGQFPLYIFTDKGIFTAEVGSAGIAYGAMHMLNREICNNAGSITGIGGLIIFSTEFGLRVLQGRQVQEISTPVEGAISNLLADSGIPTYIENSDKILATSEISTVDFLTYIASAIVGYDFENKEIIVSNSTYTYSYIFSLLNNTWSKIDVVFEAFYHELPDLYGYDDSYNLIKVNSETAGYNNVLIYTRPFTLGTDNMKKILGVMINGYISKEDETFACVYLYGSNDLEDWALLSAVELNKALVQYSPSLMRANFSAKHLILVISGSFKDTILRSVTFDFKETFTNKLR